MKITLILTILALSAAQCCIAADGPPPGRPSMVPFDGFAVEIPVPYEKQAFTDPSGLDLEAYVSGDLVYLVKLIKATPDTLTSTAIEKTIQSQLQTGSTLGATKRWEIDSKQGTLFKGFTRAIRPDKDTLEKNLYLEKVLGGGDGMISVAMAPLGDESSQIVAVGVIGGKKLGRDIENKAMYTASRTVIKGRASAPRASSGPPTPTEPMKPQPPPLAAPSLPPPEAVEEPEAESVPPPPGGPEPAKPAPAPPIVATPKPLKPAPTKPAPTKPEAVAPKPMERPIIKKGDIELEGTVTSIAADKKSLMITVNRIRMPGQNPIELMPARPKMVLLKELPGAIRAGIRVRVVGKNNGVGKPIRPSVLQPL